MKTMDLECELTPLEIDQAGKQLSRRINEKLALMGQHKEQKAEMKRKEEALENEIKRLAKAHDTGKEMRPVFIREEPDLSRAVIEVFRTDTGELVTTRPMSQDEVNNLRQRTIPGVQ